MDYNVYRGLLGNFRFFCPAVHYKRIHAFQPRNVHIEIPHMRYFGVEEFDEFTWDILGIIRFEYYYFIEIMRPLFVYISRLVRQAIYAAP